MRHLQGLDIIPPPDKYFKLSQADRMTSIRETKAEANLAKTTKTTLMHDTCVISTRIPLEKTCQNLLCPNVTWHRSYENNLSVHPGHESKTQDTQAIKPGKGPYISLAHSLLATLVPLKKPSNAEDVGLGFANKDLLHSLSFSNLQSKQQG